ncbi:helix-turn-helix domain-containing protein [Escherichia coli]
MRRLLENGIPRKQVAIIYDVAVSTLYKKFPRRHFNPKPWFKRTRYQW